MLVAIIIIYVIVGSASAVGNLGSWLFKSNLFALLLLPFLVPYYLIAGDKQQKRDTIQVIKGIGMFLMLWAVLSAIAYIIRLLFF